MKRPNNLNQWILQALGDGPKKGEAVVSYVTQNSTLQPGSVYQRLYELMYADIIVLDPSDETGHTYKLPKRGQQP